MSLSDQIYGGRAALETFPEYSCHPEACKTQFETR